MTYHESMTYVRLINIAAINPTAWFVARCSLKSEVSLNFWTHALQSRNGPQRASPNIVQNGLARPWSTSLDAVP
jgi:hypothetical protein